MHYNSVWGLCLRWAQAPFNGALQDEALFSDFLRRTRAMNFMWLLAGQKAPDHSTIARFRTVFLAEACANKYTFVWRKSVGKWEEKGKYLDPRFLLRGKTKVRRVQETLVRKQEVQTKKIAVKLFAYGRIVLYRFVYVLSNR